MSARPLVELLNVERSYGEGETQVRALRGINLTIEEREFVAVMGPSGSGKSTCMNILGCLDVPTAGTYRFRGVDTGTLQRDELALLRRHYFGFVFQGYNLLARTSARENVELPLIYQGIPPRQRRALAREALHAVGLSDREGHAPSQLSGGQQQRVAIARALVTSPALLLADEPTGNLDSARKAEIMDLLVRLNEDRHIAVVLVTHEAEMAARATRLIQFEDGRLVLAAPIASGDVP